MNRWGIFTLLRSKKGTKPIDEYNPKEIEELILKIPKEELQEGIIEYLINQMYEERARKEKLVKK